MSSDSEKLKIYFVCLFIGAIQATTVQNLGAAPPSRPKSDFEGWTRQQVSAWLQKHDLTE